MVTRGILCHKEPEETKKNEPYVTLLTATSERWLTRYATKWIRPERRNCIVYARNEKKHSRQLSSQPFNLYFRHGW